MRQLYKDFDEDGNGVLSLPVSWVVETVTATC